MATATFGKAGHKQPTRILLGVLLGISAWILFNFWITPNLFLQDWTAEHIPDATSFRMVSPFVVGTLVGVGFIYRPAGVLVPASVLGYLVLRLAFLGTKADRYELYLVLYFLGPMLAVWFLGICLDHLKSHKHH